MNPETRPTAPGPLGILQDFLNSGHLQAAEWMHPEVAKTIRLRLAEGEARPSLSKEYGLSQMLISAVGRGAAMYDEFQTTEGANTWLVSHGLQDPGIELSDEVLRRLIALRELLRDLAVANTHGPLTAAQVEALNELARSYPMVVEFDADANVVLRPVKAPEQASGRLLAILFDVMHDGSWQRLKRCPGTGCPFTFYDSSRNRTGTWCSMAVCGNRAKVRNYQARKRRMRSA
jgi:predicted RNA-binding Zn ribbon-like protein